MRNVQADEGLAKLKSNVDTLITIPNQRLLSVGGKHMTIKDAFLRADEVLLYAVRSISDLIVSSGHVNVDFADVKTVMSEKGMAIMGVGMSSGDRRAVEAAEKAISSPLLEDISIHGARGVLINVTGSTNMTLHEVHEASTLVQEQAHEDARVIWGLGFDESMDAPVRITVIATGFEEPVTRIEEKPQSTRTEKLFDEKAMPAYLKRNVKIDYREAKPRPAAIDLDDDRYDIPTFLRKQAD
jgi:cell division protein FtsZ